MPRLLHILERTGFFGALSEEDRAALAHGGWTEPFRRDDTLVREGAAADRFGVAVSGYLKLVKSSASGRETILELMSPGDVFGILVALEERPYPVTVKALSEGEVLWLRPALLQALTRKDPALSRSLLLSLGPRLRQAQSMIVRLASGRAETRIANVLLMLARREASEPGAPLAIGPALKRQDIADLAGTTVETAIRVISAWQKEGIVAADRQRFILREPDRLERTANDL